jgi:adenine-specific DNA-methyltransferase
MIKYLGSKRTLVGALGAIATGCEAKTALDLFTGTTRVAQEFKRRGIDVTANDIATYSEMLARCYIATDARNVDESALALALEELNALPGQRGYITRTFCEQSRFFQPRNGMQIDAVRQAIATRYSQTELYPVLLTALLQAADKVDSTTGVQMAYLKEWAPRAHNFLTLERPVLLPGRGVALRMDAIDAVAVVPRVDLAYLDPPYNQHRYFTNYHVWETLIRWDAPAHYGVACKRVDSREDQTRSRFNSKRSMPDTFRNLLGQVNAELVVVSYNDESWIGSEQMMGWLRDVGYADVRLLAFDSKRYVGAQIGIHNQSGVKVGKVSHLRNTEFLFIAGQTDRVAAAVAAATDSGQLVSQ